MKKIVLLRHGESAWNKENRFTGWTDVDLTEKGIAEAEKAGQLLIDNDFQFDKAYTSYLKRAVKTLNVVLDRMDQDWIPVEKSWRLNEKHYGQLQGLNKAETAAKYGEEQVLIWRRSYDIAPPPARLSGCCQSRPAADTVPVEFSAPTRCSRSVPLSSSSNLIEISCPAWAAFNRAATKKPKKAPASKNAKPIKSSAWHTSVDTDAGQFLADRKSVV